MKKRHFLKYSGNQAQCIDLITMSAGTDNTEIIAATNTFKGRATGIGNFIHDRGLALLQ
jgi:hypothetical protein